MQSCELSRVEVWNWPGASQAADPLLHACQVHGMPGSLPAAGEAKVQEGACESMPISECLEHQAATVAFEGTSSNRRNWVATSDSMARPEEWRCIFSTRR